MIPFYQVDAFTTRSFQGNPAGVVLSENELSDTLMKRIAQQTNLPATAFVRKEGDHFSIRWFTPLAELPLCGHASLASAFILFSTGQVQERLFFRARKEHFEARQKENWIELDFPSFDPLPVRLPADLLALFGTQFRASSTTQNRYLIELDQETAVRSFKPDYGVLKNYRIILTAKAQPGAPYDFVSRYFAYPDGVPEDAVTGSSHCSLVPYWAQHLQKSELVAVQVSPRGGELRLVLREEGVTISGQAVKFLEGNLFL